MYKVLHVVSSIGSPGGVQSLLWNYYSKIDEDAIRFDFAYFNQDLKGFEKRFLEKKSKLFYITPKRKNIFRHIIQLFQVIKKGDYDIVHTHQDYLGYLTLLIALICHVRIRIVHSHKANVQESRPAHYIRLVLTVLTKLLATDCFACGIDAAKWTFGDNYYNNNRVTIINNAVDSKQYVFDQSTRTTIRKQLQIEDAFVIGNVARFTEQKNHLFLLFVFKEICKKQSNARLLLIGDGELYNKVVDEAKRLDLIDRILFLGSKDNVYELLQAIDVFVLPSIFEGLPVTLVEAQIADLPCIVSDCVTSEIDINNKSVYLSLNQTYNEWADAIIDANNNGLRSNCYDNAVEAGFDIYYESNKLVKYYYKRCVEAFNNED